jgi:hypothetical protein
MAEAARRGNAPSERRRVEEYAVNYLPEHRNRRNTYDGTMEKDRADFLSSRPTGYKSFSSRIVAERFRNYIDICHGLSAGSTINVDDLPDMLVEYLDADVPEVKAVETLRNDVFRPAPEKADPYLGVRKSGPPIDYVRERYSAEWNEGSIHMGRLREIDEPLCIALYTDLRKDENKGFADRFKGTLDSLNDKRQAFCTLIGAGVEETGRVLQSFKDRSSGVRAR